jgi:putative salt-induced outer membrane protein YdiY
VDLGPAGNAAMDAPKPVAGVNPGDAAVVKEPAADAAKPPEPPPSPWKFVLDANVNYVSAANKQLDFRVAGAAVYEIKDVEKWSNSIEFFFKTVDGSTTDNNLLATSVYDRRFESNPRVLWFVKGQAQWAPLEDYEQRLSAWGGLGYEFFKKPTANLIGKIGAGYSYEFGNIQQGDPQLYASVDWDWDITENQAIVGSYWITPDFADFTNFLMLARLEWTMKMPDIPGLKLLGGVRWQYQSEVPTGDIQNDIRVYAGLRLEV